LIIPRSQHAISRKGINPNALKVLYRLKEAGFSAYLVGGGVRDLLLNLHPKDFDIATNARPEQIKKLFRNCLLIGRRFRLAHIRFGREVIEVATFRARETGKASQHRHTAEHGMLLRDNVYGTLEEDAWRRDFTINALYYNIADFSVVDYCGGMADLQHKVLRMIGDPIKRYQEDPVRLLRVIRFAGKLGFTIAAETANPIISLASLLQHVPPARLFDEAVKLFHNRAASTIFESLCHYGLFDQLFPQTAHCLKSQQATQAQQLIKLTCENTERRIQEEKTISPAFLLASILWYPCAARRQTLQQEGHSLAIAQDKATHDILQIQSKRITIPRRFTLAIREIWALQSRLERQLARQIDVIATHPRFRAAYDLLVLRAEAGEPLQKSVDWWAEYQTAEAGQKEKMIQALPKPRRKRRK
jgi:poly(A) polymerase